MEKFFNSKGIPSVSITSETVNREQITSDFRNSRYTVAFTVDLFNEGVDFPDLRVLLFLRPTESKTVFLQQLGRGLRLCNSKENVVVIDFIGNYKKANNIRKYLSKTSKEKINQSNGRVEKIEYEYSPKCEVIFDTEVEKILDKQDTSEHDITKEDLIAAYYEVAEALERKPTQNDINSKGEFKISRYFSLFGSWVGFLKEIGEHTEFSYHFPQGTHLGHVLYIVNIIGTGQTSRSYIDDKYVRFSGNYDEDKLGSFQRQTKYKIQACMELGLLVDFRDESKQDDLVLTFTSEGREVYQALKPMLEALDFSFKQEGEDDISWSMNCERSINRAIRNYLEANPREKSIIRKQFLNMDAASLLLRYLYTMQDGTRRTTNIKKSILYSKFFEAPFVKEYLDRHGLENPTEKVRRRRVPFLINVLDAVGVLDQSSSEINVCCFVPAFKVMKLSSDENDEVILNRLFKFYTFLSTGEVTYHADEISKLKEMFGIEFLTSNYHLNIEGV